MSKKFYLPLVNVLVLSVSIWKNPDLNIEQLLQNY